MGNGRGEGRSLILRTYSDARGTDSVEMAVSVESDGFAALSIEATVETICQHTHVHVRRISGEVGVTSKCKGQDLMDTEMAIRGKAEHAIPLAWRCVAEILGLEQSSCDLPS